MRIKRGSFWADNLGWLILAIALLVVIIGGIVVLTGKGQGAIAYMKDLMRFGRA